jgi:Putative zinc-finger
MASQTLGARDVSERPIGPHLEPNEIAAYVDGAMPAPARPRAELHLASCDDCRAEVADVVEMAETLRRKRRRRLTWIPAAAAAAAILLLVSYTARNPTSELREGPLTATIAPRALAPVGMVDSLTNVTWSSVPRAERYELRLFDSLGTVLWTLETRDTSVRVPPGVRAATGASLYWQVEASSGFGRAASSELVGFMVRPKRGP